MKAIIRKIFVFIFVFGMVTFNMKNITVADAATIYERENNDSFGAADTIGPNDNVIGNIGSSRDSDYFRFTLNSSGYISTTFKHDYINSSSSYWEVRLYTNDKEFITSYNMAGNKESTTTENIGLPAGTYYIQVSPYSSYTYNTMNYNLRVNYTSSSIWETEFNDSFASADALKVNSTKKGTIHRKSDRDYYKFKLDKSGYISTTFKHDYMDTYSSYWEARIYTEDKEYITSYNIAGNKESTTTENIGLPAGTYYIQISPYSSYTYNTMDYSVKINYKESSTWETEFNDSFASADTLKVNNTKNGSIYKNSDRDYYKFKLDKSGYISTTFKHSYIDSYSTYWTAYIYNYNKELITSYNFEGNKTSVTTPNIGLGAGTYYISVQPYSSYTYNTSNYSVKVNYNESSVWEREFNNSFDKSNSIKTDTTVKGNILDRYDNDYYKFTLDSTQYAKLSFSHAKMNTMSRLWNVRIYNSSKNEVLNTDFYGDKSSESTSYIKLSKGTYYVKVSPYSSYTYSTEDYSLKVNTTFTTSKLDLKATSIAYNKIKLTWNKISGASGYQIYRATSKSGTYSRVKTITSGSTTSYTNSSLSSNKTYYYKVRAYKTVNGKTVYGAYSSVKYIKVK